MSGAGADRRNTFFWQGTLIILPVIVLAAIGVFSLHQDRVLARHEATERAQTIADDLAAGIWSELGRSNATSGSCAFEIDSAGALLFPRPYSAVPVPHRLDETELEVHQAQLWSAARGAELRAGGRDSAIAAYRKLIETRPPQDFRAAARYALGVLLEEDQRDDEAASNLSSLVAEDPNAIGESGLPLAPIAELKLVGLAEKSHGSLPHAVMLEMVCSNAVSEPTTVSPELLRAAQERARTTDEKQIVSTWQAHWEEQEHERALFRSSNERLRKDSVLNNAQGEADSAANHRNMFWLTGPGSDFVAGSGGERPPGPLSQLEGDGWLAVSAPGGASNRWIRCIKESTVRENTATVVGGARHIPDYFGIVIELAGRKFKWQESSLSFPSEAGGSGRDMSGPTRAHGRQEQIPTILASASPTESGGEDLRVNVYLTSQAALFKRQNARTFWFGALVAAAAFAALAGFVAAYRAFYRQLRLSEMKSNFVSSVSHELRAPIASVRLMAESLERGKVAEAPRQQEYFRFIVQECRRLSALIENVLDFSRIEQGRKEYEFEPTDIVALTKQTVKLMEPYAAERGVALAFTLGDGQQTSGLLDIAVDGKAIQQALINLIDNAIKHSPKGQSVTVGLNLEANAANPGLPAVLPPPPAGTPSGAINQTPSSRIHLWVEDHGEGIPAAEHERIFERFYRRGSELRRETSGVGIGLSIVKHIIEAHGGQVLVRSDAGQGSRFTICLPLARAVHAYRHT